MSPSKITNDANPSNDHQVIPGILEEYVSHDVPQDFRDFAEIYVWEALSRKMRTLENTELHRGESKRKSKIFDLVMGHTYAYYRSLHLEVGAFYVEEIRRCASRAANFVEKSEMSEPQAIWRSQTKSESRKTKSSISIKGPEDGNAKPKKQPKENDIQPAQKGITFVPLVEEIPFFDPSVDDSIDFGSKFLRLRDQDQQILLLRYGKELRFAEIASILGISIESAKKRAKTALENAKKIFQSCDEP